MTSDPASIAREYFSRMKASDLRVLDLFHEDASLRGLGSVQSGMAEIEAFYRKTIQQAKPSPRLVGPMLVQGGRVVAEISIDIADSLTIHAIDLFEVEEGRIASLTYFIADYPRKPGQG